MKFINTDETYMRLAISEARHALPQDIPVGAVIVLDDKVIASKHNLRETTGNALHHAELLAIESACISIGSWNLSNATLYVTLEPCPMCAGAAIMSRIGRIVIGASAPKDGACGSVCNLLAMPFTHGVILKSGVLAAECGALLSDFFKASEARI